MFTAPLHFPTYSGKPLHEGWISIPLCSIPYLHLLQVSIVHCLHMDKLELVNHTPWWAMEITSRLKMFLFLFFILLMYFGLFFIY